jgi:hypothetical protein
VETGRKAERQKCGGGGGKEAGFSARSTLERTACFAPFALGAQRSGGRWIGPTLLKASRRPVRVQRPTHS